MGELDWEKRKYLSEEVKRELFYISFKDHNYENAFETVFTKDYWYSLIKEESKETIENDSENKKKWKRVEDETSVILQKA